MGSIYSFSCSSCGYEAEVSGGADCGHAVRTQTVVCEGCRDLFDIVIGTTDDGERPLPGGGLLESGEDCFGAAEDEVIQVNVSPPMRAPKGKRCPECRSRRLFVWSASNGCPKCRAAVKRSGPTIMWD